MNIHEIPKMTSEELEKVLKHLPEPTYAEVSLFGNFDYSEISRQAQEVVQGAKLQDDGGLVFRLEDASKEKILDIYRKSNELREVKPTRETGIPKRIELHKVGWYLDDHVQVELTPWEVNAKYRGQEPTYISQMRQELAGTNVRLGIEVNK
ncbi:MAG: hypothetical protein U9R08_04825 [Nanoarchaeota archaeon]|nr:hypothetical protein [Nanoarchaeota archaeon]